MICMPGFIDTHWHLWTSLFRPFVRVRRPAVGYFPVSNRLGQLMVPEDSYRSVVLGCAEALSAGVTTVHNWAHNVRVAGARRRRARRHARRRHPRTVRLRPGAGHAERAADGLRRHGARAEGLDAERRHAHARHQFAQCRRQLDQRHRRPRRAHDRAGEAGLGRRPQARAADHAAHVRPEPGEGSSRTPGCSAPTCSSCIRCSPRRRSARS